MNQNKTILAAILAVLAIAAGAYIYLNNPNCTDNSCTAPVTGLPTVPITQTSTPTVSAGGAADGDTVGVLYTGRFESGEVFDTTDAATATANKLSVHTDPLTFTIGEGQMIPGFEAAVKGMKENETKTVTIPAKDAYGEYDPSKVVRVPREETLNRTEDLDRSLEVELSVFKGVFGKDPKVSDVLETTQLPWKVEVTQAGNETAKIKAIVKVGDVVALNDYWNSTVVAVTEEKILIRAEPTSGQIVDTPLGKATVTFTADKLIVTHNPAVNDTVSYSYSSGKVTEVTATEIAIDTNSKMAGKNLVFEIKLAKLEKPATAKSDKPTLDMYVMSFCPYGQQAEKAVEPVAKLLGDKMAFTPHFVIYGTEQYAGQEAKYCEGGACSMHGVGELHEDMRQLCLWQSTPAKWWAYVDCINSKAKAADVDATWKTCAQEAGIDATAIESCQASQGVALVNAEKALDQKNSVSGSPTLFVNGNKVKGANAEAIKKLVCDAFDTPPAECSQALPTTTAAATGSCA
jgi:FKBP-type peptidyl-prolyl cis-trans isomerase 2